MTWHLCLLRRQGVGGLLPDSAGVLMTTGMCCCPACCGALVQVVAQCSAGAHLLPCILCVATLSLSTTLSVSLGELCWLSSYCAGWAPQFAQSSLWQQLQAPTSDCSSAVHMTGVVVSRLAMPAVCCAGVEILCHQTTTTANKGVLLSVVGCVEQYTRSQQSLGACSKDACSQQSTKWRGTHNAKGKSNPA